MTRLPRFATRWLAVAALMVALPCQALFKVIGPDGKVTYTDRLPSGADGRVTPMKDGGTGPVESQLPLELRQATQRYPVTLYVIANCAPCDAARALLRQRGVPHTEKLVATEDDAEALQRLTGSRDAPSLTIGSQPLRGLASDVWNSYLDSAGYPRESRLPANYQFQAATPVTERREATRPAARPVTPRVEAEPVATEPSAPTGIRF